MIASFAQAREVVATWTPEERALLRSALEAQAYADAVAATAPVVVEQAREPRLLRVPEVAERLGIGKNQVYELHHAGILPALDRGGRRLLWLDESVDEYLRREAEASAVVPFGRRGRAS